MNTKLKEMSLEELRSFINETVDMRLEERLGDPDIGLDVKPEIIEEIRRSRKIKATIPVDEVVKRTGLKW